jgi:hypothetical protein
MGAPKCHSGAPLPTSTDYRNTGLQVSLWTREQSAVENPTHVSFLFIIPMTSKLRGLIVVSVLVKMRSILCLNALSMTRSVLDYVLDY